MFSYADYIEVFNSGDDALLVERFYHDDLTFTGGSRRHSGKQGLLEFLAWAHDGVREVMRVQHFARSGDVLFADVDMDFHASKERPDFPFGHLRPGDTVTLNDCEITAFALPHDSLEPVGYSIFDGEKRFTLATDLGEMTAEIYSFLQKSQAILLESNFDEDMLRFGPYPYPLKRRILSRLGHLPNSLAGQTAARLLTEDPDKLIIFGHMSETNNDPRLVLDAAFSELAAAGLDPLSLRVEMAGRTEATGIFEL